METRQEKESRREQAAAYKAWLNANKQLIAQARLPAAVVRSRDDWASFLFYGYHTVGPWMGNETVFDLKQDQMGRPQQTALNELKRSWAAHCAAFPILDHRIP